MATKILINESFLETNEKDTNYSKALKLVSNDIKTQQLSYIKQVKGKYNTTGLDDEKLLSQIIVKEFPNMGSIKSFVDEVNGRLMNYLKQGYESKNNVKNDAEDLYNFLFTSIKIKLKSNNGK
jgi:hypothetical protein